MEYGVHIIIHERWWKKKSYVEGVELFCVGQTNVLGRRYPIHFHIFITVFIAVCLFTERTHNLTATENIGYDVK